MRFDQPAMNLTLRYMQTRDIRSVSAIDSLSFKPSWSKDSYVFEIKKSRVSHMAVLEEAGLGAEPVPVEVGLFGRLRHWIQPPAASTAGGILGYGGMWKIDGEAHISTIAIHPDYRRRGYGEILLAGMFHKALQLDAEYIVLEVRVSNAAAQHLYCKYGFRRHGRKRNYYRSNREDAYDMRVCLDAGIRCRFERLLAALQQRHHFRDDYSRAARPR